LYFSGLCFLLLSFALSKTKHNYFFPETGKRRKKGYAFKQQLRLADVKVFWKKILPGAKRSVAQVWRFFSKTRRA